MGVRVLFGETFLSGITEAGDASHVTSTLNLASIVESLEREAMYSRTQNENGTYNTRCLDCFMTVGFSVETENELREIEAHHICPEKALNELSLMEKAHEEEIARR